MTNVDDFDPEHPDLQHEVDTHPGEATDNPADTAPAEGVEPDPGELPAELPDPEP